MGKKRWEQPCSERPSGRHYFLGHGGYGTATGEWQAQERCSFCGTVRPAGGDKPERKPGPLPGVRSHEESGKRFPHGVERYQRFWESVLNQYHLLGLPQAVKAARDEVGVSASMASRWVRSPRPDALGTFSGFSEERLTLLEAALDVRSGRWQLPQASGIREWRDYRRTPEDLRLPGLLSPEELMHHGNAIWQTILSALCVAAVVRGKPFPHFYLSMVPEASEKWLDEISEGDLFPTSGSPTPAKGPLRIWLQGDWPTTVIVSTRARVVGVTTVEAAELPDVTVRLRTSGLHVHRRKRSMDSHTARFADVSMPVVGAPKRHSGEVGDYALVLWLYRNSWWDLDVPEYRRSSFVPRVFPRTQWSEPT